MTDKLHESQAMQYFRNTAFDRTTIKTLKKPEIYPEGTFKTYPEAPKIMLPRTSWKLQEARIIPLFQQRRSIRRFSSEAVPLPDLAFMLWASQGITAQVGNHFFRTVPSAGALYPVETYISIKRVDELSPGLYHFNVRDFQLELLEEGDTHKKCADACLNQQFMEAAAVNFIWTGVARRCMSKYGERGARYLLLDAAHICQNTIIAAEAVGCGGCPVAAFYDQEVAAVLDLEEHEELPLYAASIGKKGKTQKSQ